MKKLPEGLAQEITDKIDIEGFDYWLRDGGWAFSQLQGFDDLIHLASKAKDAMDEFENALEAAGVPYD